MKTRKITNQPRPPAAPEDKRPRERRTLHVRYGGEPGGGGDEGGR